MCILLAISVEGNIYLQTDRLNLGVLSETECGTLHPVIVATVKRVLINMSQRYIELVGLRTASQAYSVLGLRSPISENETSPIGITKVQWVRAITHFLDSFSCEHIILCTIQKVVVLCNVSPLCTLVRVHLLWPVAWLRERHIEVVINADSTCLTALGNNLYDTVRSTGTVNSCSRSILQDRHRFNIVWRKVTEVNLTTNYTVDDVQRSTTTTDTDRWSSVDTTTVCLYDQTRRTTCQTLCDVGNRDI